MKKLALVFAAIVLALSILPAPAQALATDLAASGDSSELAIPETPEPCDSALTLCGADQPSISSRDLLISEIAARVCPDLASSCTTDEQKAGAYVEIFNAYDAPFNLSGWKIQYKPATTTTIWQNLTDITGEIAPQSYQVFAVAVGNASDGWVRLVDELGAPVETVGYGDAKADGLITAPSPKLNRSVQRCETAGVLSNEFMLADLTRGQSLTCVSLVPECSYNSALLATDANCQPPCEFDATLLATDAACVPPPVNNCDGLVLSEIGANLATQFVEVQNISANDLDITGCEIMTNRSAMKFFAFASEILPPNGFETVNIADTDLTLTKTTTGTVYLLNSDGSTEIDSVDYADLKADTSFAKIDGVWQQTYAVTPNAANVYQQFPPCDDGYFRNLTTGRCDKIVEAAELADCGDGYFRNPETNRCKKLTVETALAPCAEGEFRNPETNRCKSLTTDTDTLTPCDPGYERNPDTNRCRKIASDTDELTPCADGYERNPDTNRCRKIAAAASANFAVANEAGRGSGVMWQWMVGGTVATLSFVVAWQYRAEIGRLAKKVFQKKAGEKLTRGGAK